MTDRDEIYVDMDDVLSHTISALIELLERHYEKVVTVDEVEHFDLSRSFGLSSEELSEFMRLAHLPHALDVIEPVSGAGEGLEAWCRAGYEVAVMTGRPPSSEDASRRWLERHEIPHSRIEFVDKYGRPDWSQGSQRRGLSLQELAQHRFALAVEDSLDMAVFLATRLEIQVVLMDRPWNRDLSAVPVAAARRLTRCHSWEEVLDCFPAP